MSGLPSDEMEIDVILARFQAEADARIREAARFAAIFECDDFTGQAAPCVGIDPSDEGPLVKAPWDEMTLCPLAGSSRCAPFRAWDVAREQGRQEQAAQAWNALGRALGVPKKLWWFSFTTADPRPAVQRVRRFLDDGEADAGRVLILAGSTGVGKSVAAACLIRAWSRPGALFIVVPELVGALLSPHRREGALERTKKASLLILDEFGAEYAKADGLAWALLEEILAHREAEELSTVITTNLLEDELRARWSDRILDRLRASGEIYNVTGPSLRTHRGP